MQRLDTWPTCLNGHLREIYAAASTSSTIAGSTSSATTRSLAAVPPLAGCTFVEQQLRVLWSLIEQDKRPNYTSELGSATKNAFAGAAFAPSGDLISTKNPFAGAGVASSSGSATKQVTKAVSTSSSGSAIKQVTQAGFPSSSRAATKQAVEASSSGSVSSALPADSPGPLHLIIDDVELDDVDSDSLEPDEQEADDADESGASNPPVPPEVATFVEQQLPLLRSLIEQETRPICIPELLHSMTVRLLQTMAMIEPIKFHGLFTFMDS